MQITLKGRIAHKLRSDIADFPSLEVRWNPDAAEREYRDADISLGQLTQAECRKLHEILRTSGIQGTKAIAADIGKYLRAAEEGVDKITARVVRQGAWMLEHFIAHLPHHLIFSQDAYEGDSYVGYYVEDVDYVERYEGSGSVTPEHIVLSLLWIDKDRRSSEKVRLWPDSVLGKTPAAMLEDVGYVVESPELIARLARETEAFYAVKDEVGRQYTARGLAANDLDDATGRDASAAFTWNRKRRDAGLRMDPFGRQTTVVVDVMSEKDDKEDHSDRSDYTNLYRWHPWNMRFHAPSDEDLASHLEADEDTDFAPEIQLPVHPLIPVFDLKRHLRVRVHVNNLTPYRYRPEVAEGLVIPQRDRDLVDMLVDESADQFQDVVQGKGASLNILAGGAAGTGKTLTAEVFAERKGRPLYSVQCSQLGTDPESVEGNLTVILQRANRWGAILLLDEADVYIRRRGDDLQQNAIIGVFLRLFEYASCILWMTTNLPGDVDDAIASRCIVLINYGVPAADDQRKIWHVLAALNRIELAPGAVDRFVARHPSVSGRDVKQLLKLASFIARRERRPVDLPMLQFALRYKPTASLAPADHHQETADE